LRGEWGVMKSGRGPSDQSASRGALASKHETSASKPSETPSKPRRIRGKPKRSDRAKPRSRSPKGTAQVSLQTAKSTNSPALRSMAGARRVTRNATSLHTLQRLLHKGPERQITSRRTSTRYSSKRALGGKFHAKSCGWDENRTFLEGRCLEVAVAGANPRSGRTAPGTASGPARFSD